MRSRVFQKAVTSRRIRFTTRTGKVYTNLYGTLFLELVWSSEIEITCLQHFLCTFCFIRWYVEFMDNWKSVSFIFNNLQLKSRRNTVASRLCIFNYTTPNIVDGNTFGFAVIGPRLNDYIFSIRDLSLPSALIRLSPASHATASCHNIFFILNIRIRILTRKHIWNQKHFFFSDNCDFLKFILV